MTGARSSARGARRAALAAALLAGCAAEQGPPARPPEVPPAYLAGLRTKEPEAAPAPEAPVAARVEARPFESCADAEAGFAGWLEGFRQHAIDEGVGAATVTGALAGLTYDPRVIELDRSQRSFQLPFAAFARARVTTALVARGKRHLIEEAALLARIEDRFGVPPPMIVALWGLETGFGADTGGSPALRSLATLAYDCRRAGRFRQELLSALRVVARGDLTTDEMVGAWAGELGQTQFLPSSYERFALDFDGDGRADLIGSVADALGSTGRYLQEYGWRRGEGFAPGSANFEVLRSWNRAEVYRKTIALFAAKLSSGRPAR